MKIILRLIGTLYLIIGVLFLGPYLFEGNFGPAFIIPVGISLWSILCWVISFEEHESKGEAFLWFLVSIIPILFYLSWMYIVYKFD